MIKKTLLKQKTVITHDEYEQIQSQAQAARELLEDDRFKFFRDYFQSTLSYIEKTILNNTVRDAREQTTLQDKVVTFFTPKKVQLDELAGQYKLINKFFEDMQYYIALKNDLDTEISTNRVQVTGGTPKDISG